MIDKFAMTALLATLGMSLCIAPMAQAQDSLADNFGQRKKTGATAGLHVTIPFGAKNAKRAQDKARVGLMLNLSRQHNEDNSYLLKNRRANLLDIGLRFDGQPVMLMGGKDIYTPLFQPESLDKANLSGVHSSKNTVLIIAGGALAAGAAVALASGGSKNKNSSDTERDGDDDG